MSDLISRQNAIDAWDKLSKRGRMEFDQVLMTLPSAEPKVWRWIFNPKDAIELMFTLPKCSVCDFESADGGNFCSNCGAKMRGKEE